MSPHPAANAQRVGALLRAASMAASQAAAAAGAPPALPETHCCHRFLSGCSSGCKRLYLLHICTSTFTAGMTVQVLQKCCQEGLHDLYSYH